MYLYYVIAPYKINSNVNINVKYCVQTLWTVNIHRIYTLNHSKLSTYFFEESLKMTGIVESFTMSSLSVISLDKPKVNNLLSRNR